MAFKLETRADINRAAWLLEKRLNRMGVPAEVRAIVDSQGKALVAIAPQPFHGKIAREFMGYRVVTRGE